MDFRINPLFLFIIAAPFLVAICSDMGPNYVYGAIIGLFISVFVMAFLLEDINALIISFVVSRPNHRRLNKK